MLVLEIVAGRLLAPYIGVSLYTWTSIIGVILAGLSLGNWVGGVIAQRGGGEFATGITLAAAGCASYAILLLLMLLAQRLQATDLSLMSVSFLYVTGLFFVPAVLLGVVTPVLTTLALQLDARSGRIVGRMHALAALGSILGTFVTGYWLVQYLGTRITIISVAVCLLLLSVPFLVGRRRLLYILVFAGAGCGALTAATYSIHGFDDPCDIESNYYCLRVIDEHDGAGDVFARSLVLDHMTHSVNHRLDPGELITPYVHLMDEFVRSQFAGRRDLDYFFAGGGAYTQPRAVRARAPTGHVTVSEIDPAVTSIAVSRLFVDINGMTVLHTDARMALTKQIRRFDVVVTDVFHDLAVPYHLTTVEFARLVRSRLARDGVYLVNAIDVFPDPKFIKAVVKTLLEVFPNVDVWIERPPGTHTRLTYVISATDRASPDRIQSTTGTPRTWYRVTDPLMRAGTPVEEIPVLTDDLAPVDRLLSVMFTTSAGN